MTLVAWRKHGFPIAAALMLPLALPETIAAQPWKPARPVAFIAGSAAGGSIDLTARVIQRIWDEQRVVGQSVIVINKPGAGNGIAWSYLNERGGDGHAIAIGTTNLVTNPAAGVHPIGYRDVTTLALLFDDYVGFVVKPDSTLKSVRDAVDRLRQDPAAVSIAFAPSIGSGTHSGVVATLKAGNVRIREARLVPYKSAPEAIIAMLGGEVDIVAATPANLPGLLQAGRVRVIGVTAPQRLYGAMAGVPTLKEQGVDAVFTNWRGVIGPRGMRREHAAYWEAALEQAAKTDAWRRELERYFWISNFRPGAQAQQFVAAQSEQFRALWAEIAAKK